MVRGKFIYDGEFTPEFSSFSDLMDYLIDLNPDMYIIEDLEDDIIYCNGKAYVEILW